MPTLLSAFSASVLFGVTLTAISSNCIVLIVIAAGYSLKEEAVNLIPTGTITCLEYKNQIYCPVDTRETVSSFALILYVLYSTGVLIFRILIWPGILAVLFFFSSWAIRFYKIVTENQNSADRFQYISIDKDARI
jgi:hypothetical protein